MTRFAALESWLPTHPASLIPGLPQLALLLAWIAALAILWAVARLLVSVVCNRFLHAHVSVGHVGWASLNDLEWSIIRQAAGTRSAKIQRVHIQRISLTLRGRGAKDNDIRLAWLGLLIKGVTVSLRLAPSKETNADSSMATDHISPNATLDDAHLSPSSPLRARPFTTTPSPNNLGFSQKNTSPLPSHTSPSALRQLGQLSLYTIKTIHHIRRRIRTTIVCSLPEARRKSLLRTLNRATRVFRHRVVAPLLTHINSLGRRCSLMSVFLALEITDITVDIPQIKSSLKIGLVRAGGELVRRNRSYVGLWARLEQLSLNAQDVPKSDSKPHSWKSAASESRALEMTGPLLIEAQANFDPAIGMAGLYHRNEAGELEPRKTILDLSFAFLRTSTTFGKDEKIVTTSTGGVAGGLLASSIKIRLNSLLEVVGRVEDTISPHPHPHFGPHLGPHLHARYPSEERRRAGSPRSRTTSDSPSYEDEEPSLPLNAYPSLPAISARRNPAAMLKSITFSIPLIKLQAILPEYAEKPRTTIAAPRQIQLELRLRGLAAEAVVSKTMEAGDRHLHWFGRHTILKFAAKAGFEKFDIDAAAVGSDSSKLGKYQKVSYTDVSCVLAKPVRMLEVSPSGLHLSSSWLPQRFDALFREPKQYMNTPSDDLRASTWGGSVEPVSPYQRETSTNLEDTYSNDRSSGLTVMEADIGGVNGEASLEIAQGLLLVLTAHNAKKAAMQEHFDNDTDNVSDSEVLHKSWQAYSPPTLAVVIEFGRCGYRVLGPQTPHRASFGPGEDDAGLSPGFSAPSLLCVHITSLAVTLHTRYADVPVHRTEAQRRELKQEIKRGSIFIPNILFRGSQSQRASEQRAKEARKRMFDSPLLGEDQEEWSLSTSPVPSAKKLEPGDQPSLGRKDSGDAVALSANLYKENDFLCFITPDDGRMPEHARRIAGSHSGAQREVIEHPFVYFVDASVTFQKIDVYLLSPHTVQARDTRSNPNSASSDRFASTSEGSTPRSQSRIPPTKSGHVRQHSRPHTTKRHDILSVEAIEVVAGLEVFGREISTGEHVLDDAAFLSLVDSRDARGSVSFVCDGPRSEVSNMDVHHCISSILHLTTQAQKADFADDAETLASSTAFSISGDSDPTPVDARSEQTTVTPLSDLLPPNIHFSFGITNVELYIAGPDPRFMPGVCRGLAMRISQFTVQRYRQDRYVVGQSHAHVRAPLGLMPDLRAHAQSVFDETHKTDQAFVTLQIRGFRVNPLKDSGKENTIMRAKPPVNEQGRSTTADVDFEFKKGWRWCQLSRDHFYTASERHIPESSNPPNERQKRKADKKFSRFSAARVRDFFFVEDIDVRITFWTRDIGQGQEDDKHPSHLRVSSNSSQFPARQDCIGLAIRVPQILIRCEMFQVYCFLLAFSAVRSLLPPAQPEAKRSLAHRPKPHLQLKCNISQVHLYWTLPHSVKLYACLRRVELSTYKEDLQLELESGVVAGESHICPGVWEDIIRIRKWALIMKKDNGYNERSFVLKGDGARLRIPCKYPFSEIVDNLVTFIKLSKQLSHQFVHGKYSSAIEPRAESPKRIPEIRIDLKILVLEAADDPFEAKLNLVWNAGKIEQRHRLNRGKLYAKAIKALQAEEAAAGLKPGNETRRSSENDGPHAGQEGRLHHGDQTSRYDMEDPAHSQHKRASLSRLRERLDERNSKEWIRIIRDAQSQRTREEDKHLRNLYGHIRSADDELPIQLLNHHGDTPLMRLVFRAVDIKLSKPTFDLDGDGLSNFMFGIGKGIPRDTLYSLNIPFHLDWKMNEAIAHIRDYPIPLLDVPAFVDDSKTADEATQSWHLTTDFVIAEELAGSNSTRHVTAVIVPAEHSGPRGSSEGYYFRVPRTAMPVKFYATPVITIHSDSATRLSWGNSVQPAIQDVMRVMDSLTKPPPDPSERVGFWDKIRLILHWQIDITFKGKGPLHLILKGSRDPYSVQGSGAGFSLSWHEKIRWKIGFDNADKEFFQILSDRFVLGIPGRSACLGLFRLLS